MSAFLLVFPGVAILCAPALWLILGRPGWLKPSPKKSADAPSISIIIPARNEEQNIRHLLASLQTQDTSPLEIIVVNDGSEDRTAQVSQELGAAVLEAQPLPGGWHGKPWACHQGAERAKGEWLLFLDADTVLQEGALTALQQLTSADPKVYSLCPYHIITQPYEEFSAFFNVLMLAGSNAFTPIRDSPPTLFGQSLLLSKAHYEQVGTHAVVRDQVLENFHLSKHFQDLKISTRALLGKGLINMRMFPHGPGQLWASWQKGFTNGAAQSHPRALLFSSIWLSGLMFTLTSLVFLLTPFTNSTYLTLTGVAYLLGVIQCCYAFRLAGNFSFLNALLFPFTLLFYQSLFFTALIKKKRGLKSEWKGRSLD